MPIFRAAAAWCSSSAIRCWPTATTVSWAVQGRAGQGGRTSCRPDWDRVVDQPQSRLDPLDYRHPIVQPFRGRGQASLLTTPVFKYYKL